MEGPNNSPVDVDYRHSLRLQLRYALINKQWSIDKSSHDPFLFLYNHVFSKLLGVVNKQVVT